MSKQLQINRSNIPPHGTPVHLVFEEPDKEILDNGLEVFLINAGTENVLRIDIVINAGSVFQEKKLTAASVGKLLKEGTRGYDSSEIATLIDYYGAYLDVSVTKDTSTITLYLLSKHLKYLIPVIGHMLMEATFPEEELRIHVDRQRQEYLINSEKVRYKAMLEFNKLVFGEGSAYGQVLELADFDMIERNDLAHFYKRHYQPSNAYLVVSGNINDEIVGLLNQHIGKTWQPGNSFEYQVPNKGMVGIRKKFIEKPDAMQSAIRIGRPIFSKKHPDYNKFLLLNTILGGYFGSRLMSNLREDKGFTYGVHSFVTNYKHAGFFSVSTEVKADSTEMALKEIMFELNRLQTEKVGKDELSRVKNYIYGTFLRTFDGPFALAERFKSAKNMGEGFLFYKKSLNEILKVTPEELLETAGSYFSPEEMITLVVGKVNNS
ncbi:MAG: insulinase family protein [Bacteroidetes bacterium]|nr:insulinase family protein [Bacteroidota bacterium]